MTQVTIKSWPMSQYCIECEFGEFLESKTFNNSNYICFKNLPEEPSPFCQEILNEPKTDLTVGDIKNENECKVVESESQS